MVIQLSMERTWNDHQLLIIVSFQPDERGFGEIAGIRSALHWIVDCPDSELREALQRLTNYRDMLDEWYYRT